MKTDNNSSNSKQIADQSYGILSLRDGVFLNAFGSMVLTPLIPTSTSSNDYVSKYFHFRVPGVQFPVDSLLVVSLAMNAVGMWGCYKKSKKLIRYHKYYCYYESVCTPLVVIQSLWCSYRNIGAVLAESNTSWESFRKSMKEEYGRYVFVAFGAFMGTCFAQMLYAAYLARQYEKHLQVEAPEEDEL